jgi:hypothetical protein
VIAKVAEAIDYSLTQGTQATMSKSNWPPDYKESALLTGRVL